LTILTIRRCRLHAFHLPSPSRLGRRRKPNAISLSNSNVDADAIANAVPGTFADAHVDSGGQTYCHANANIHCNADTNTGSVVNADDYTKSYCNADRNRHGEAYT
jgi:hypothetical protein